MAKKIKCGGRKRREKIDLFGRKLEMPGGLLERGAHIELTSNREAVVDGCRAIVEYCAERVKLNVGRGSVCFLGNGLEISSLDETALVIRGDLRTLEFCV